MIPEAFSLPIRPLPEPLRGSEAGTFAADTVKRRLPEIARRAIAENDLDALRSQRVEALATEIGTSLVTPIDEPEAADAALWAQHVTPYLDSTWFEAPWFFVETYFFRRLLAATGYSQPGSRCGVDPFIYQKRLALDGALGLAARLGELTDASALLRAALWSNRIDLSLWPVDSADSTGPIDAALNTDGGLLVDDLATASVSVTAASSIHFVLDNAGSELVADLALAAFLLEGGKRVKLHAKPHPTYVSDVTADDFAQTIDRLGPASPQMAELLRNALAVGNLEITSHPYWVSPLPFWRCPSDLVADLARADIIIVKGDANYRRLLGDLHWELTTPITDIVRPPRPLLALRTAKAEVAAGLDEPTIAAARSADPNWMTNGRWGMVQYVPAASPNSVLA